jgi:hypothetical protein
MDLAHRRRLRIEVVVWRRRAARGLSALLLRSGGYRMVSAASAGSQAKGASDDESASHRVKTFALVDRFRKTASFDPLCAGDDDARSHQCSLKSPGPSTDR